MNKLSIFDAGVLQPWGLLDDAKTAAMSKPVPDEWDIARTPAPDRAAHFDKWRHEVLYLINDVLWPRYDPKDQVWVGGKADKQYMDDLTAADLLLMHRIRHPNFGVGIFFELPRSPLRTVDVLPHKNLFDTEDSGSPLDPHRFYDSTFTDPALVSTLKSSVQFIDDHRQNPINFWFKNQLQRPRPMQMALRHQQMDFIYNIASTSITPSMCSGHCLQGVMDVGGSLELLLERGVPFDRDRLEAHGQWSVDFGDRRVMAGVHYPSDNICSWILFLRAARFLFRRPEVWLVIGYAIRHLSFVYHTLKKFAESEKQGSVYLPALQTLNTYLPPEDVTLEAILEAPTKWQQYQP